MPSGTNVSTAPAMTRMNTREDTSHEMCIRDSTMSVFGAALGMAALQALWFTGAVFRKLAYPARIAGFGACGLPVLALCAWAGPWFPLDDPGVWAAFALVYLFILAGVTAGYTIYFKKTAGGYDQALARYREKNRR